MVDAYMLFSNSRRWITARGSAPVLRRRSGEAGRASRVHGYASSTAHCNTCGAVLVCATSSPGVALLGFEGRSMAGLVVRGVSVRFGGLSASGGRLLRRRTPLDRGRHRPQRRRQDDAVQRHQRLRPSDLRHDDVWEDKPLQTAPARVWSTPALPAPCRPSDLFPRLTALENVMVGRGAHGADPDSAAHCSRCRAATATSGGCGPMRSTG